MHLVLTPTTLPDATSHNVLADLRGREKPDEIVLLACHLDSWDVGTGAIDDGAGCVAVMETMRILKELGLRPRRTIRGVLFTNEENGLAGGRAYRESVGEEIEGHVAAIEMDGGAERPLGFGFGLNGVEPDSGDPVYEAAFKNLQDIGALLDGIEAGEIFRGGGGADIGPHINIWNMIHFFAYRVMVVDNDLWGN